MRFAFILFACCSFGVFNTGAACNGATCNCPEMEGWPTVMIELSCGTATLPTLLLSGVCAGKGGEQDGKLVFGATDAGVCHVTLVYSTGSTFSAEVQFGASWSPCGSDPHGCGEGVFAEQLALGPRGLAVLNAGGPCEDAGSSPSDSAAE